MGEEFGQVDEAELAGPYDEILIVPAAEIVLPVDNVVRRDVQLPFV